MKVLKIGQTARFSREYTPFLRQIGRLPPFFHANYQGSGGVRSRAVAAGYSEIALFHFADAQFFPSPLKLHELKNPADKLFVPLGGSSPTETL